MGNISLYPYILKPVNKSIIWGGQKLERQYGKIRPGSAANIAESWELCVHANGVNEIANGEYAGCLLTELLERSQNEIVAPSWGNRPFPLLIKLIDACDRLSVQVHPDDGYAQLHAEPYGKTEMWYIMDAEPDAQLVYGLNQTITRDKLAEVITKGELEEYLNYVPVKRGDVFFIPAGMIHAIGKGILIAEIQQSSDTTYRVYDYNRRGADGSLRELHISQAVEVADTSRTAAPWQGQPEDGHTIADCEYFAVKKYLIANGKAETFTTSNRPFDHILCLKGEMQITCESGGYTLQRGMSCMIPSGMGEYTLSGECELLRSYANV